MPETLQQNKRPSSARKRKFEDGMVGVCVPRLNPDISGSDHRPLVVCVVYVPRLPGRAVMGARQRRRSFVVVAYSRDLTFPIRRSDLILL